MLSVDKTYYYNIWLFYTFCVYYVILFYAICAMLNNEA